jgi:hypothetical protein
MPEREREDGRHAGERERGWPPCRFRHGSDDCCLAPSLHQRALGAVAGQRPGKGRAQSGKSTGPDTVWSMVYGLWSMVYGKSTGPDTVWSMVYSLWSMVYGLWSMVKAQAQTPIKHGQGHSQSRPQRAARAGAGGPGWCSLFCMVYGLWSMVYGLWSMVYGLWSMGAGYLAGAGDGGRGRGVAGEAVGRGVHSVETPLEEQHRLCSHTRLSSSIASADTRA